MHWLSQNYQWVFSGIGVLLLALLLERWRKSQQRPSGEQSNATLTAQGAKIEKSPVVSGTGNTQNIIGEVHYHEAAAEPAPAAAAAVPAQPAPVPAPYHRPLPNMVATGVYVGTVQEVQHGVWRENFRMQDAFIVQFTNEAQRSRPNVGGLVKAQLIYRDGVRELRRVTGCWLNQAADMTEFRVDETHGLMVGLMLGQEFSTVGKRRVRVDLNADEIPRDVVLLRGFEQGTVSVRLTHADTGDVLYEGQFQLNTHPPEIIRLDVPRPL